MDSRAQGSLEYMLLIGVAVLIAAVAVVLVTTSATSGKNQTLNQHGNYLNALNNQ